MTPLSHTLANQEDNNGCQSVGNEEAGNSGEMIESNKDGVQQVEEESSEKNGIEEGSSKDEDDSINIMLDEGEDFDMEKDKEDNSLANTLPKTASPPRPETAPVVQPFTSRDTISLATLNKAPSENSSMRVAVDESESVGTQESLDGKDETSKGQANGEPEEKPLSNDKVESDNNSRNLWVSGISSSIRAADLKAAFAKLGKVNTAKVVSNARSPGARVYGYVTMNSVQEAVKCLELNKTELNGKIITVERAKPGCVGPPKISASQERTATGSKEAESETHAKKGSSKEKEDLKASTSKEAKLEDKKEERGSRSSRDRGRDHHGRDHRDHRHSSKDHHRSRSPIRFPPSSISSSSSSSAPATAAATEATTAATESSPPSSSSKRPIRERLSFRSPERVDKPPKPGVLTFAQIRQERERERAREEERRRRQRERDRREEEDRRQRELERKRRAEEETIRREREELRREREKIEREKAELMRLERERQRLERERLQREKEELERLRRQQTSRIEDAQRQRGSKRGMPDDPYYDHDRSKRSSSGSAAASSRYEPSSSHRYADQDRSHRYADQDHRGHGGSRYPSAASSSSRGDYHHHHHHREPGPPRGSTSDRNDRGSRQPWGAPPGPPSGGGGPGPSSSSSNNKPPYPPLMGSGSGGDWGSGGRSSGGPQPPQPPILSGGPNVPSCGNSGAPSSSGMGYGSRGGGGGGGGSQYSSGGSGGGDRFNSYKPGGPMMGGGRRY